MVDQPDGRGIVREFGRGVIRLDGAEFGARYRCHLFGGQTNDYIVGWSRDSARLTERSLVVDLYGRFSSWLQSG